MNKYATQNDLLLNKLLAYYKNKEHLERMLSIINGESSISLRIVDWFVTNYAKQKFTSYTFENPDGSINRFKVYIDYKLQLKAYSKRRFDPFCRWDRIMIPYGDNCMIQTTIGQLNFFKWAIENNVIAYITENYKTIENDMNDRNSSTKKKSDKEGCSDNKTRKKREELSVFASRSIKKENIEIIVSFD
jgi:hypothetical protein